MFNIGYNRQQCRLLALFVLFLAVQLDARPTYITQGKVHKFKYTVQTETTSIGTTDKFTGVKITANVEIANTQGNDYSLKLTDVSLQEIGAPGTKGDYKAITKSNEFAALLQKNTIVFTLEDDDVTNVRVPKTEPVVAINVKRAIISGFQLKKSDDASASATTYRHDIQGYCPVAYSKSGNTIKLTKNINKCKVPRRENGYESPYSFYWNSSSIINSWAEGNLNCEYELQGEQLKKGNCVEKHSVRLAGIKTRKDVEIYTEIKQTYELVSSAGAPAAVDTAGFRVTGINYEHEGPSATTKKLANSGINTLKALVEDSRNGVRLHIIQLFDQLVDQLRTAPDAAVQAFVTEGWKLGATDIEKHLYQAYIRDALVQGRTIATLKALRKLAQDDQLTDLYINHIVAVFHQFSTPEYIAENFELTKKKPTRLTLVTLGAQISNFERDNYKANDAVPAPVKSAIKYFTDIIGSDCDHHKSTPPVADADESQKQEYVIAALKAIGNAGVLAQKTNANLEKTLIGCAKNHALAHNVTVESIRALRKFKATPYLYDEQLAILKNKNDDIDERQAAYNNLVNHWQSKKLVGELVKILETEQGQIHEYILTHLKYLLAESEEEYKTLIQNVREASTKHPILNSLPNFRPSSRHKEVSRELSTIKVGGLAKTDLLWDDDFYLPKTLLVNLTSQILGEKHSVAQLGLGLRGVENVAEYLFGPKGILRGKNNIRDYVKEIKGAFFAESDDTDNADPNYIPPKANFNKVILDALDKLQKQITFGYKSDSPIGDPEGELELRVQENTLAFTSLGLIKDRLAEIVREVFDNIVLQKTEWKRTRVVKFVDAKHIIPTISGLPLIYSDLDTLAYSIRAEAEGDFSGLLRDPKSLNVEWRLNPSVAFTEVSKQAIVIDGFTEAGVQYNISAFHSIETAGKIDLDEGVFTYNRKVLHTPQEYLTLLSRNYLVRGKHLEELANDKDQITSDWCADKFLLPSTGVKICRHKSYVDTSKGDKPLFLFAGNFDYRISGEVPDASLTEFKVTAKKEEVSADQFKYDIKLEAVGGSKQRELVITHTRKPATREFHLQVSIPSKPNAKIELKRERLVQNGKFAGYHTKGEVSLIEGRVWTFDGKRENTTTTRTRNNIQEVVSKSTADISFATPWSSYKYNREFINAYRHGEVIERTLGGGIEYKCNNEVAEAGGYLHKILPETFWENKQTAKINWKTEIDYTNEKHDARKTVTKITTPQSVINVNTDRTLATIAGKRHLYFHVDKKDVKTNAKLTFLNFNYNSEVNPNAQVTRSANLTVPRYSWQFTEETKILGKQQKRSFTLRSEKLIAKSPADANYVGWWTPAVASKFTLEDWTVKLRLDVKKSKVEDPTQPRECEVDAELLYPRGDKHQTIAAKGKFTRAYDRITGNKEFTADYTWESSYLKLKKRGHIDFWKKPKESEARFEYNAILTNIETNKELKHNIYYRRSGSLFSDAKPFDFTYRHNLTARFLNFDLKVDTTQRPGKGVKENSLIPHNMVINVVGSSSSPWQALNTELKKTWDFDTNEGTTHFKFRQQYVDIDSEGKWIKPVGENGYHKEIHIKSKGAILPSRDITVDWKRGDTKIKVEYPDTKRVINYHRTISPDKKETSLDVTTQAPGQDLQEVLHWVLRLDTPHDLTREIKVNRGLVRKGIEALIERWSKLLRLYQSIRDDPEHPLNKNLAPYLTGGTIAKHVESRREFWIGKLQHLGKVLQDVIKGQEPLFRPTIELIRNLRTIFRSRTLTGSYLSNTEFNFFEQLAEYRDKAYQYGLSDEIVENKLKWHHPQFTWERFDKLPVIKRAVLLRGLFNPYRKITPVRLLPRFGALHDGAIYTFDGKLAASKFAQATFGDDCTFLIANDFVYNRFSIVGSKKYFTILTPQLTVSFDKERNVYFNGSTTPAELPFFGRDIAVTHESHEIVIQLGKKDLKVFAGTGKNRYIFIETDRWNHNKTLGILGNNDYQAYNDLKLPSGKLTNDPAEFINAYELTKKANCKASAAYFDVTPVADPKCDYYFADPNSPLSHCFALADPQAYKKICESQSVIGGRIEDVVKTYVHLCNIHLHTPVELPHEFAEDICGKHDEDIWSETIEKKAEIILWVHEAEHITEHGVNSDNLGKFAKQIETELKGDGFTDIKFAVVGYGGEGFTEEYPHFYTSKQKVFAPAADIATIGLKNLDFHGQEPASPEDHSSCTINNIPHEHNVARAYVILNHVDDESVNDVENTDSYDYAGTPFNRDQTVHKHFSHASGNKFDVNAVAKEVAAKVKVQAGKKQICSCHTESGHPSVRCDLQ